jgi:hypothetical protein
MYKTMSQPLPSIGTGLTHYLTQIRKFPILTQEEETALPGAGATTAIVRQLIAL